MVKENIEIALNRSNIYQFFSQIYLEEPTARFIEEIKKPPLVDILKDFGVVFDDVLNTDAAVEELRFEYTRLFLGTGPKHAAPYESVYTDTRTVGDKETKNLMWGEATQAVKQFYAQLGYEPNDNFKDMPDHIAVELDFMHKLVFEEANAYKSQDVQKSELYKKKQQEFLENHLLRWVDMFANEVRDLAKLNFYRSITEVMAQFVKEDQKSHQI